MATTPVRASRTQLLTGSALLVLALGFGTPALAAHGARLSADLVDQLAAGSASIDVIVHGTAAEVDALATRYGVKMKRRLRSGAVLTVSAGQLDALRQDD